MAAEITRFVTAPVLPQTLACVNNLNQKFIYYLNIIVASSSSSIGVGIGGGIAAALIIIIAVYIAIRRRRSRKLASENIPLQDLQSCEFLE